MKIGVFDSGVGGLSVLAKAIDHPFLQCEFIYYADTENAPYSYKTTEEIKKFVFKAIDDLLALGVDIIVLACNTATSVAVKELRENISIPIIGMEPAIKPALKHLKKNKLSLVTATPVTLRLDKFNLLLESLSGFDKIIFFPLPKLVEFAEAEEFDAPEIKTYLLETFQDLNCSKIDNVVLGCTHFIFFKKHIKSLFSDSVSLFDGIDGTINQLISKLPNMQTDKSKLKLTFYESGKPISENRKMFYLRLLNKLKEDNIND